jgi:hypothetical protein
VPFCGERALGDLGRRTLDARQPALSSIQRAASALAALSQPPGVIITTGDPHTFQANPSLAGVLVRPCEGE